MYLRIYLMILFFSVQSEKVAAHRYSSPEQSNGAVVTHALSYAARFPIPS